jgi:hypothetical protein
MYLVCDEYEEDNNNDIGCCEIYLVYFQMFAHEFNELSLILVHTDLHTVEFPFRIVLIPYLAFEVSNLVPFYHVYCLFQKRRRVVVF